MNSTLSLSASETVIRSTRHRASFQDHRSSPPHHLAGLSVSIEGSGARWEGETQQITPSTLTVVLEGCPLVVASQSIHFHLESHGSKQDLEGCIQKITPVGTPNAGQWSRVQLDVTYDALDEVSWQHLKTLIRKAAFSSSSLRGRMIPLDSGDSLWRVVPVHQSTPSVDSDESSTPREINGSVKPINQPIGSAEASQLPVPISSMPLEFPNRHGQLIRAYYDAPHTPLSNDNPVMILSPGYGETKREYIMLAYYFASNGFHVLRYDHTHHVGSSDGEHVDTTLSMMREDLEAVVNHVRTRWPKSPRGLVATSLSGRVAMKAIANETQVDLLVLMTPIVDVQRTLQAVHREDLIGNYLKGERKGESNVLGFNVSVSHWLEDAIDECFSDVLSTIQDVSSSRTPVVIVSAEHDAWVQQASVNAMALAFGQQLQDWYVIPEGLHRVLENPRKAKHVYRLITQHCQQYLGVRPSRTGITEPSRKAIGTQNRKEREHMKAGTIVDQLSEFWADYLDHFHHIVNYADYQQLLDHMLKLMGSVDSGESILDAGCGNGNFAPFFYLHEQQKNRSCQSKTPKHFQYIGIDFVPTALQQAKKNLQTVVSRHSSENVTINDMFNCTDLNDPLPFPNDTFDKVVSNLVLGYLTDPVATLKEFFRVLSPNGTLVLSNLKPNSDLSVIYTNSVQDATKSDEIEEARRLLSNSGKIRQAEGDGIFQFHDEEELRQLLQQVDPTITPMVYSTFANQAYIAVIKKESAAASTPAVSTLSLAKAA